jgi:transcriptional regulator with XRE-family HTH domain
MADEEQKKIFSHNLRHYLFVNNKTQKEVADAIRVSPQTFNTWIQGIALPRMGKVQLLADYFHIGKSDLIEVKLPDTKSTNKETQLLQKYRSLPPEGQEVVNNLVDNLCKMVVSSPKSNPISAQKEIG